jgi:hypothetical protein
MHVMRVTTVCLCLAALVGCSDEDSVGVVGEEGGLDMSAQALLAEGPNDELIPYLIDEVVVGDQTIQFIQMYDEGAIEGLTGGSIVRTYLGPMDADLTRKLQANSDVALTNAEIYMGLRGKFDELPTELAVAHFKEVEANASGRGREFRQVKVKADGDLVEKQAFDFFESIPGHHDESRSFGVAFYPSNIGAAYGCTGKPDTATGAPLVHINTGIGTLWNSCNPTRNLKGWIRVGMLNNSGNGDGTGKAIAGQICYAAGTTSGSTPRGCFPPVPLPYGHTHYADWANNNGTAKRMDAVGTVTPTTNIQVHYSARQIVPN